MKRKTSIYFSVSAVLLLFVFVGCTHQQPSNTNITNQSNTNLNQQVNVNTTVNTNTNSDQEVDTSDWLTYTNEEYGFSFKYPKEWGEVKIEKIEVGKEYYLNFSQDVQKFTADGEYTPTIHLTSKDYNESYEGDEPNSIDINSIDLTLSNEKLENFFLSSFITNVDIEVLVVDGIKIVRTQEDGKNMAGIYTDNVKYYIPYAVQFGSYNLLIIQGLTDSNVVNNFVKSFDF